MRICSRRGSGCERSGDPRLHLLAREALALYQRKVAADGVVLFHISNRYVELRPVLAALAADAHSPARRLFDPASQSSSAARLGTEVVAVGQPGHRLDDLTRQGGWRDMAAKPSDPLWTDLRSDLIGSLRVFGRDSNAD